MEARHPKLSNEGRREEGGGGELEIAFARVQGSGFRIQGYGKAKGLSGIG